MTIREPKNPLESCTGFEWDEWNVSKNWDRHRVAAEEAESVFFHDPLLLRSDVKHSGREKRYFVLGETPAQRRLFIAFTIRRGLIRIISARDMNQKEDEVYTEYEEKNS